MNITFLIGNGFDLNLGLNTKYKDFLNEYISVDDKDTEIIREFKESLERDAELWSNAEIAFGRYTSHFKRILLNADDYYECYEDFCNNLSNYLRRQEKRLNYEAIHDTLSQEIAEALISYYGGFRETQRQAIENSSSQFGGGYVFNFINFNYTSTLDKCIEAVQNNHGTLGKRKHQGTNYENKIGALMHVHGTLDKDLILGVNDESQISDVTLFDSYSEEYINQLIKIKANEMAEENTDKKAHTLLQNSNHIYIYGMSIGETDALWWERICNIMQQKKNVHLIIHCFDAPERDLFSWRYHKFTREKRQQFLKYCNLSNDIKEDIEKRIHIDDSNIFNEICNLVNSDLNKALEANTDNSSFQTVS